MLKFIFTVFALFSMGYANSAPDRTIPEINPGIAHFYHFTRQDLNFEGKPYRLFIAAPKKQAEPAAVLYLLDGNGHFPLAVNNVKTDRTLPIIVGIGYPVESAYAPAERTRDYTFKAEGEQFKHGGGAADFLRFIASQVKPSIEAEYSVDKCKQFFFGHSFGGLFGLYVLFHQPELFRHYTLASPSIWWGNGEIVPKGPFSIKSEPQSVLITLGEYEENPEKDPDITPKRLARIKQRQHIASARKLANRLAAQMQNVEFRLIPQANHGQAILPAIRQTLRVMQKCPPSRNPNIGQKTADGVE